MFPTYRPGLHDEHYSHNDTFILILPNQIMKIWNLKTLKLAVSIPITEHLEAFTNQRIRVDVYQCTFSDNKLAVHLGYVTEDHGLEIQTLFWNLDSFNPSQENIQFNYLLNHTNINPNDEDERHFWDPFCQMKCSYMNEKYFCVNFKNLKEKNDNFYVFNIENFD